MSLNNSVRVLTNTYYFPVKAPAAGIFGSVAQASGPRVTLRQQAMTSWVYRAQAAFPPAGHAKILAGMPDGSTLSKIAHL
jgi:hypothetical protein